MARGRNYLAGGGGAQSLACASLSWTVLSSMVVTFVSAYTESSDVSALNVMYTSMKSPSKLAGWKSDGGDPCGDSWKGIKCSGSKVTEISLPGYGLTGSMGYKLSELKSVTYFDMSRNNFKDSIPYQLPPNLQQIDLSDNEFNGDVPYSISEMTNLKEINLNHNRLKGQLSDMFSKLTKLTKMDLSFNSLSGDLPQSFQYLSELSMLHLQNNKFTGSIDVLAFLPLDDLNVKNNKFTGWIPNELKGIRKIETDGNSWSTHAAPPPPPGGRFRPPAARQEEKGLSALAITGIIFGILIVLGIFITICSKRRSKHPPSYFDEEDRLSHRRPFTPLTSVQLSVDLPSEPNRDFKELKSFNSHSSSHSSFKLPSFQRSASKFLKPPPDPDNFNSFSNNELKNHTNIKMSTSVHAAAYSLADLQTATGNFAMGRLLGEGSIGRVYRAKYADGKVLAVKKIDSSLFQGDREIEFTEIITLISMLHHPNICELVGYCSEQGHNMLLYDYYRNGSLHEFLHLSDDFSKPLTWNTRVRIALGTARAVEYLHETCSPSCAHKNIKSSNILLDVELNPRLTDCGLAIFHEQRIDEDLRVGYNAPECTKPSACTLKSDIYSFGVVMLELMTGRMPFDSKKPKFEQSLVRWATPQLHDIDALENMADPALRGLYSPKSLSRFADVVALCVRLEPEFRPPISEVVEALVRLVERSSALSSDDSDN